jgi:hypothetical protein
VCSLACRAARPRASRKRRDGRRVLPRPATTRVVAAPIPSSRTAVFASSTPSRIAPRRVRVGRSAAATAFSRRRSAISAALSPPARPPTPSATASKPCSESIRISAAASSFLLC